MNQKVGGLISSYYNLRVKVFLGIILNHKLLCDASIWVWLCTNIRKKTHLGIEKCALWMCIAGMRHVIKCFEFSKEQKSAIDDPACNKDTVCPVRGSSWVFRVFLGRPTKNVQDIRWRLLQFNWFSCLHHLKGNLDHTFLTQEKKKVKSAYKIISYSYYSN